LFKSSFLSNRIENKEGAMAKKPTKICKRCSRIDQKGRKKCPACGFKMETPDPDTMAEIKKKLKMAAQERQNLKEGGEK
jgi:RNA polymerase subunit RPABC4/transcription elongation factor Spt4